MSDQLLKGIRSIEEEASRLVADAERHGAEVVRDAEAQSLKLVAGKDLWFASERARSLKSAAEDAVKLREKRLSQKDAEVGELKVSADKRREQALALVMNGLSKLIGD